MVDSRCASDNRRCDCIAQYSLHRLGVIVAAVVVVLVVGIVVVVIVVVPCEGSGVNHTKFSDLDEQFRQFVASASKSRCKQARGRHRVGKMVTHHCEFF